MTNYTNQKYHINDIPHLSYISAFKQLLACIDDNGFFKNEKLYKYWLHLSDSLSWIDESNEDLLSVIWVY